MIVKIGLSIAAVVGFFALLNMYDDGRRTEEKFYNSCYYSYIDNLALIENKIPLDLFKKNTRYRPCCNESGHMIGLKSFHKDDQIGRDDYLCEPEIKITTLYPSDKYSRGRKKRASHPKYNPGPEKEVAWQMRYAEEYEATEKRKALVKQQILREKAIIEIGKPGGISISFPATGLDAGAAIRNCGLIGASGVWVTDSNYAGKGFTAAQAVSPQTNARAKSFGNLKPGVKGIYIDDGTALQPGRSWDPTDLIVQDPIDSTCTDGDQLYFYKMCLDDDGV